MRLTTFSFSILHLSKLVEPNNVEESGGVEGSREEPEGEPSREKDHPPPPLGSRGGRLVNMVEY